MRYRSDQDTDRILFRVTDSAFNEIPVLMIYLFYTYLAVNRIVAMVHVAGAEICIICKFHIGKISVCLKEEFSCHTFEYIGKPAFWTMSTFWDGLL